MTDPQDDIELSLTRLRDATEALAPRPSFTASVMAALEAERAGFLRMISGLWRQALPIAALLATISAVWAYANSQDLDAQISVASDSEDPAEIDW